MTTRKYRLHVTFYKCLVFRTAPSSRGTLYQGYLPRLQALQSLHNGGVHIRIYRVGQKGGTREAGTVAGWHELFVKRGGRNGRGSGRPVQRGRRHRRTKISTKLSTLVGYVLEYGQFCVGGLGVHTGGGTFDMFWNVQHLEWSERGTGIRPAQNVPGQHEPGHIPRN